MNGSDGRFIEEVALYAAEFDVVVDVLMHISKTKTLQVTACDDT
jgi:hypothetical protein